MTINLKTTEKAVKWGQAGFSLVLAVISIISLAVEFNRRKPETAEEPNQ